MDLNNLIEKAISQAIQIRRYLHSTPSFRNRKKTLPTISVLFLNSITSPTGAISRETESLRW